MDRYKITVLTPTYNRRHTLSHLAQSLFHQSNLEFNWLVIDDGSTDGTKEFFDELLSQKNPINVEYRIVENGGKARAINYAVQIIDTEFTFIVDSDDYLLPDTIDKISLWIDNLPADVAGVAGVKGVWDNNVYRPISGEPNFEGDYIEITNLDRKKYNLQADMAEVYRTEILRRFPFQVWPGEKFVPEAVVWDEIALRDYPLRWYKDVIYICEYMDDGLTKNSWRLLKNNPMGYAMMYNHQLLTAETQRNKWGIALQMTSCIFLAGEYSYFHESNDHIKTFFCILAGFLLSLRRRIQFKEFLKEDTR